MYKTTSVARSFGHASTFANARTATAIAGEQMRLAAVWDPLRTALVVLVVLLLSRAHQHYTLLASFRPALLLVVASIGYAYLHPRYLASGNILRFWPMRVTAMLGVWACLSTAFGISLGRSALFILDSYSKTLACAFLVALAIRHVRDLYTFVWAYVIACGILAYLSLFVFKIERGNGFNARLGGLYMYDSNDVCVVVLVGLALALLLLTVVRGWKRGMLLVVLLGIGTTLARSGSRGGFVGLLATGVAALFLANGVSVVRRLFVAGVISAAIVLAAPPGYWRQMQTIAHPEHDYNLTSPDGRKAVTLRGLGYLRQHPVFGIGIDNFVRAECTISPLASVRINEALKCSAPHNSYLQAGTELGVPGFFLWVFLVFGGIIAPLRLRRRLPQAWRRGKDSERFLYAATTYFAIAMVAFAVTSFFLSFAWMDPVYVLAAFLTGLYASIPRQLEMNASVPTRVPAQPFTRRFAGWRVALSAQRAAAIASSHALR